MSLITSKVQVLCGTKSATSGNRARDVYVVGRYPHHQTKDAASTTKPVSVYSFRDLSNGAGSVVEGLRTDPKRALPGTRCDVHRTRCDALTFRQIFGEEHETPAAIEQ